MRCVGGTHESFGENKCTFENPCEQCVEINKTKSNIVRLSAEMRYTMYFDFDISANNTVKSYYGGGTHDDECEKPYYQTSKQHWENKNYVYKPYQKLNENNELVTYEIEGLRTHSYKNQELTDISERYIIKNPYTYYDNYLPFTTLYKLKNNGF